MFKDNINALVDKYYSQAVKIRHEIHMYPETCFEEVKTAKLIADTLQACGIEFKTGIAKTGVMGIIRGGKPGKTVLLRADIDGLELTEEADVPYKSARPGYMHGCGHDGHVAGLLLCAMVLNEMKAELSGNIKLMFQPAEETDGGALPMIEEGILENPKVDAAFGVHLWGNVREGKVMVQSGPMMAAPDEFAIKIIGKGGHGAMPHLSIDPIVMAAEVINGIQSIISRRRNPVDPAVITIGQIIGGDTHNVIPQDVKMRGTIRTFSEELRKFIPQAIEKVISSVTSAWGGSYEFKVFPRYPALINDVWATEVAHKSVAKVIGEENIVSNAQPNMGGEDFAYLCQKVPASFMMVGIAPTDEPVIHHNPKFQWDDRVLKISARCLAQVAVDFLDGK